MKITQEQFEDIITVGEGKAAATNEKFSMKFMKTEMLPSTDYEVEKDDEGKEIRVAYYTPGFIIDFRPETQEDYRDTYHESMIYPLSIREENGVKSDPEKLLSLGFLDFVTNWDVLTTDFIITYNSQKYASWEPFAKAFGITELVTIATKVPKPLAIKLQKICEEEGETPSWRTRLLIQEYLTERIKERVRRVMFEG
jgi:hypothetical protein